MSEKFGERTGKKAKRFSGRFWLNIITILLIIIVLVAARKQLYEAWKLLGQVNIWILLLLIPLQFASYYTNSEIFFTYLRARGQLRKTSALEATSMALELNFVNHVFPSGGVSGISYMVWRLGKLGVSAGQATMAQLMRYVVQLGTFALLLAIALVVATLENRTSNWVVMISTGVLTSIVFLVVFGSYLVGSEERMKSFAHWLTRTVNAIIGKLTFKRRNSVLSIEKTEKFFLEFHDDYMILRRDKKLLIKPTIWAVAFNLIDLSLFMISFWALNIPFNVSVLLIAYGAAAAAGFLVLTPGGAGAYEAIMVAVLTAGGMSASAAFAGVVLTRATLIAGSLLTGFMAYQHALKKYGQPKLDEVDFASASK
ncbi:flippase-like domain-containing protein [Candidatus Saccharibacteria bacterium]|nr:MAG: flippase-like domain-containing protein [Candidatus Saccharibacteria bacterium]